MSFTDEIRKGMENAKNAAKPVEEQTRSNFDDALFKLSGELLKKVNDGDIPIDDVKDIKDIASVYVNMQQTFSAGESSGAPQASPGVATMINNRLNAKKQTPEMDDDEAVIDLDELEKLDDDAVNKLIDEQGIESNKDNNVTQGDEAS